MVLFFPEMTVFHLLVLMISIVAMYTLLNADTIKEFVIGLSLAVVVVVSLLAFLFVTIGGSSALEEFFRTTFA